MPSHVIDTDFALPLDANFSGMEKFCTFEPKDLVTITRDFEYTDVFNSFYRVMLDIDLADFVLSRPKLTTKLYSLCIFYTPGHFNKGRLHALMSFMGTYGISDFNRELEAYLQYSDKTMNKKPWLKKLPCLDYITKVWHSFVCKPDLGNSVLCVPKIHENQWLHNEGTHCDFIRKMISLEMSRGSKFTIEDRVKAYARGSNYRTIYELHCGEHCKCMGSGDVRIVRKTRIEHNLKYLSFFDSDDGFDYESFLAYEEYEALPPEDVVRDYESIDVFSGWYHIVINQMDIHYVLADPRIKIYSMCLGYTKTDAGEIVNGRLHGLISFRAGHRQCIFEKYTNIRHGFQTLSMISPFSDKPNWLKPINCLDYAMSVLAMMCYREGPTVQKCPHTNGRKKLFARKVYLDVWLHDGRHGECYKDLKAIISTEGSKGSKYICS